jgi:hypothetical protein
METSQAVILPPLQLSTRSRAGDSDRWLPRLSALAYQPIDSENGEIRLVDLLPGQYDDMVRMVLHAKNLNDKPCYEALSYAWGTTLSSNRASVNCFPVRVQESLDLGLRRLRLTSGPRTLWVDALCINQSDVRERSHQVKQMSMIYKSASQVVVWLGEWPDLDICPHPQDCRTMWIDMLDDWCNLPEDENDQSAIQVDEFSKHLCQHAVEISKLPWFQRLWIIQEFLLASIDPEVAVGIYVANCVELFTAISGCLQVVSKDPTLDEYERRQAEQLNAPLKLLLAMKQRREHNSGISLFDYSGLSRYAVATDPRDRIYGLLGLIEPYVAEPIVPDYSKAWPQVLAEATIVMISEAGLVPYVDVDFAFPSTDRPGEGCHAPSWSLDFSRIKSMFDIDGMPQIDYSEHKLGSERIERRRRSLRLSEDSRTLSKHGQYVGTITTTFIFTTNIPLEIPGYVGIESAVELHEFYHEVLRPKGIALDCLYEALHKRLNYRNDHEELYSCELDHFTSALLGHKDEFVPSFKGDRLCGYRFAVFLTEKGEVGITWLDTAVNILEDDILVALFGRQMPFILRPVQGGSTYRMINLAYVSGRSGEVSRLYKSAFICIDQDMHDWIYDAADGCSEYAIV